MRLLDRVLARVFPSEEEPTPTPAPKPTVSAIEAWRLMVDALVGTIADGSRRQRFRDVLEMTREAVAAGDEEAARGRVWQIELLLVDAPFERAAWTGVLGGADVVEVARRVVEEAAQCPGPAGAEGIVARDLQRIGVWFPDTSITLHSRFGPRRPLGLGRFRSDAPSWWDQHDTPSYADRFRGE